MIGRARNLLIVGLFVGPVLCLTWSKQAGATNLQRLDQQRAEFAKVLQAQKSGNHKTAAKSVVGLEDYPLYQYYVYNDLRRRLFHYPTDEVAAFLAAYQDSYLAQRLRHDWLKQLARGKRWRAFLDFYVGSEDTTMQCLQLQARIHSGQSDGVVADTRKIWLAGRSLPDECDDPFKFLYASEQMDDELVWSRISLAMQAGKVSLARYLANKLESSEIRADAQLWQEAHNRPDKVLKRRLAAGNKRHMTVAVYAIDRLARRSITVAEKSRYTLKNTIEIGAEVDGAMVQKIAIRAAKADDERQVKLLDQIPDAYVNDEVERYRLRAGIVSHAWPELARWTALPPHGDINQLRWRYWHGRAQLELGNSDAANTVFELLAQQRDYYGFLAADKLERPYAFNFASIAATEAEKTAIFARPGIARAHELFRLDKKFQARREWHHELSNMTPRLGEVAAVLASKWGWHDQAIYALGRIRSYDDLEIRFPVLFREHVDNYARKRDLEPARVYAIMRSESAFTADARSPAGALGLMQLMPATARETAKRIGLKLGGARQLYSPKTNIALGTAYLSQMSQRYHDHLAMTAAAYNAGPHRVKRWRKRHCEDAEIWIESIPFKETRRYVRRAFFYTAIYEWRLQQQVANLGSRLAAIPAAASGPGQCS